MKLTRHGKGLIWAVFSLLLTLMTPLFVPSLRDTPFRARVLSNGQWGSWVSYSSIPRYLQSDDSFEFQLLLPDINISDIDRVDIAVDDLLIKLAVNRQPIFSDREFRNSEELSALFRRALKEKYVAGKKMLIEGTVRNTGGPSNVDVRLRPVKWLGNREFARVFFSLLLFLTSILAVDKMRGRARDVATVLLGVLAVLIFYRGAAEQLFNLGRNDWDILLSISDVSRKAVMEYGQWPLWNPYSDGGIPMLGQPVSPGLSPYMLFVYLFGTVCGAKLIAIFQAVVGFSGMYFLCRYLRLGWLGSVTAAMIFEFNGAFVQHFCEGHFGQYGLHVIPWALLYWFRSRYVLNFFMVAAAALLSLVPLSGSIYEMTFAIYGIIAWSFFETCRKRSLRALTGSFLLIGLTLLFSAPKILSLFDYSTLSPRSGSSHGGYDLELFWGSLISVDQVEGSPNIVHYWHEYAAYISWLGVFLVLCGLMERGKRNGSILFVLVVSLSFAVGHQIPFNAWNVFDHLPFVNSLVVPTRWNYLMMFCFSWFAGVGAASISRVSMGSRWQLSFLLFAALLFSQEKLLWNAFSIPPSSLDTATLKRVANFRLPADENKERLGFGLVTQPLGTSPGRYSNILEHVDANIGIVNSYNSIAPRRSAVGFDSPNYKGLVFVEGDAQSNFATITGNWSPAVWPVQVDLSSPAFVVLNQNFFSGWEVEVKGLTRKAMSRDGLVSAYLPSGEYTATFRYRPAYFFAGLIIQAFTLVVCVVIAILSARKPSRARGIFEWCSRHKLVCFFVLGLLAEGAFRSQSLASFDYWAPPTEEGSEHMQLGFDVEDRFLSRASREDSEITPRALRSIAKYSRVGTFFISRLVERRRLLG